MDYSTESVLQVILALSTDTFKDNFLKRGGISDLPDIKKRMFMEDTSHMWGKYIT